MTFTIRPYDAELPGARSWGDLGFTLAGEEAARITARGMLLLVSLTELLDGLAILHASPPKRVFVFEGTGDPFSLRFEKRKAGNVEIRHRTTTAVVDFRGCLTSVLTGCAPLAAAVRATAPNAGTEGDDEVRLHFLAAFARLEIGLGSQV